MTQGHATSRWLLKQGLDSGASLTPGNPHSLSCGMKETALRQSTGEALPQPHTAHHSTRTTQPPQLGSSNAPKQPPAPFHHLICPRVMTLDSVSWLLSSASPPKRAPPAPSTETASQQQAPSSTGTAPRYRLSLTLQASAAGLRGRSPVAGRALGAAGFEQH